MTGYLERDILFMLTHAQAKSEVFFLPRCPKGAVCQRGYSSEQVHWVNQTVPLEFLGY